MNMYPVIFAALGAAAAFYGFPLLREAFPLWPRFFPALIFAAALPAGLCRVLASFPGGGGPAARRRSALRGRLAAAFSLGLCLGTSSAALVRPLRTGLPAGEIRGLSGILRDDPRAFAGGGGMGSLALSASGGRGGVRASAGGTIPVFFPPEAVPRIREFGRGAELYLEGSFLPGNRGPGRGPSFRASSVHIVRPAPPLEQFRSALRLKILEKLVPPESPPSWGPLAAALILGVRDNLDAETSAAFQAAGCGYILALSGMHLAVFSAMIAFLLRRPLGIKAAALCGGVLVTAYVFLAGAQPSLVRAAIMYLLGLAALLGNMKRRPLVLLALAFLIQLVFQPGSGKAVSFILSYLALGGILLTGGGAGELFRGRLPGFLAGSLSASLGAFLATAAVTVFFFGPLRPAGILAGLFIMPLASAFIAAALVFLALSFTAPFLTGLPSAALSLLADMQDAVVFLAARVPALPPLGTLPVLAASCALSLLLWYGGRRRLVTGNTLAPFH